MSTDKDNQNLISNLSNLKMDTKDSANCDTFFMASNGSPPDFDFSLPCRFFKSSFARSLSLNNASNNQWKSLDYDIRTYKSSNGNEETPAVSAILPLSEKYSIQDGQFYQQNEANITKAQNKVFGDAVIPNAEEKPPALPARRPLSLHNFMMPENLKSVKECQMNAEQKFQQNGLTPLRQQTNKPTINSTNNSMKPANCNNKNISKSDYNNKNYIDQPSFNHKLLPHHHFSAVSSGKNSCNNSSVKNNQKVIRKNINNNNNDQHITWAKQQTNVEQQSNICEFEQADESARVDELNSNYHDATKLSSVNKFNNNFHNSHQMLHMMPAINIHNNQQQQQQHQHQLSTYEKLNDNTTNVEAVILQNQVDTLQWQLKQVETSCDMYRAVMEEVARFLERYQSQKQQQQLQQQQQQQQMALKKHLSNSNNKLEQIPRSKSLFQVYSAGGHEKSKNENSDDARTSLPATSYLRARSSTNLIDQQLNNNCSGKSKNDQTYEAPLKPCQSYCAFKDFTWRRSPKKNDSRLNIAKDDVEEKINQEAFRLLRTIQNLLNTSQHQPDLAHHRHSLAPVATSQMGRLSNAMSTTSVTTLPGPPMLNSTCLSTGDSKTSTVTSDSTNTSPNLANANDAASNNLAPEMLFLRSVNMRDSRLSLRSSTDSSVHSTSSAVSSTSSKLETDEEPSPAFLPPSNILTHKQQHHLPGSSTEDESGFSSISSFPDIGVPLNSTILPSSIKSRSIGNELKSLKTKEIDLPTSPDSSNSTLKANIVGLPFNTSQDMSSHRWDSPSKTYHNASNKFQKFSALTNEDSNAVLWV